MEDPGRRRVRCVVASERRGWSAGRGAGRRRCTADDDLVAAPPPARWSALNLLGLGMSWNALPIVRGRDDRELHCYGS